MTRTCRQTHKQRCHVCHYVLYNYNLVIICLCISAETFCLTFLLCEEITIIINYYCDRQSTALQSHQCCWLVLSPVSSILEAAQDGGGPAPSSHPDVHTPAGESDTHPAAVPHRGHQPGPPCSPVCRVITKMSQVRTS